MDLFCRLADCKRSLLCLAIPVITGCNPFPEHVSISDPRVQTLMHAAESFDRADYGFQPLPKIGMVYFESKPRPAYDATVGGKSSKNNPPAVGQEPVPVA